VAPVISLEDAKPEDRQFVFDADPVASEFGNGLNGRVPRPRGADRGRCGIRHLPEGRKRAKDLRWRFLDAVAAGAPSQTRPGDRGSRSGSLDELELRAQAGSSKPNGRSRSPTSRHSRYRHRVSMSLAPKPWPTARPRTGIHRRRVPKVRPGRECPPKAPSDASSKCGRRHSAAPAPGRRPRVVAQCMSKCGSSAGWRLIKGAARLRLSSEPALRSMLSPGQAGPNRSVRQVR